MKIFKEILGLLLIITSLMGIALILTSCDPEDEIELNPNGTFVETDNGYQENNEGTISYPEIIEYKSDILNITIYGTTREEMIPNNAEIDFSLNDFDTPQKREPQIKEMLKRYKVKGAKCLYVYKGDTVTVNPKGEITYYLYYYSFDQQ